MTSTIGISSPMGSFSGGASTQFALLSQIPQTTLQYWPGYITFAIIDNVQGAVASAIPSMGGGVVGSVYNSAVRGFFKTLQFVTWDAIKGTY